MRLALFSDRHLEAHPERRLTGGEGDVLAAIGDIHSDPAVAVQQLHEQAVAPRVLYILGNHEYSGHTFSSAVARARTAAKGTKVQVLARNAVEIDGIVFLGATLWSGFDLFGPSQARACMDVAQRHLRDFQKIKGDAGLITPEQVRQEYQREVQWLGKQIEKAGSKPVVALTHFAPGALSAAKSRARDLLTAYYVNPLEQLVKRCRVWAHGHTHGSFDYCLQAEPGFGRVVSNAQGFSSRQPINALNLDGEATAWETVHENPSYQEDFCIDIT